MKVLDLWKANLSRVKSERTVITYTHALEAFIKHLGIDDKDITQIDPQMIYTYVDKSNLSVSSTLTHLSAINHFYKFVLKRGYISKEKYTEIENIVDDIREELAHSISYKLPKALTKEGIQNILGYVKGTKYEKVYTLLLSTGLRLSEYLAINKENFYLDKSSILWVRLPANITKRRKERIAPVISYDKDSTYMVTEYLLSWIEDYERNFYVNRGTLQVFTYRLSQKLGIPFSVHSFRHTYITNLVNNGFSAEIVKEFAGHASIRTTIDIYYKYSFERARKMVESFLG